MAQFELSSGWQCKERSPDIALVDDFSKNDGWIAARVPGSLHEALWEAGRIGDPYCVAQHPKIAWIAERDFLYRCRFDAPAGLPESGAVDLEFDGLDTIATVWLNDHELFHSDNMFVPARIEVRSLLRPRDNELRILFQSALVAGKAAETVQGERPVWNGDRSRVYVRKAQYQYGWDFGPTLLGVGPWRPVRLRAFASRIADLRTPVVVAPDLQSARLELSGAIETAPGCPPPASLTLTLQGPDGALLHESTVAIHDGAVAQAIEIKNPALWWPHGHGEQPLYRLTARLLGSDGQAQDEITQRLGARRVRLVQDPLPDGETFYFEINNRPIYCGGANWIPPDLLPNRVSPARYRALLSEAVRAKLVMLRIWGGGIYEEDVFYDLCDELGILVWQDFLFACGLYPADDKFANSVAAEAAAAIKRLRHHASLIIWAGNNEDYSIAASQRAYQGPREAILPPGTSSLKRPIFDARRIYEEVLPQACAQHDSTRPYWPGSPYSRQALDPNAPTEGDRHIWEIWHFPMLDYQDYGRVGGRFASEFGMQGVPDMPTLSRAFGQPPEGEKALALLNKGQDGPDRIRHYIERNLPKVSSLEEYIYATQVMQAEALAQAVRIFRRQFDASRRNGGALVWQFDDCWPGISWSMLAFCDEGEAVRRKPSLYALRRELMPFAIGLCAGDDGVAIWVVTPPGSEPAAQLRIRAFDLDGKSHLEESWELQLAANQAQEIDKLTLPTDAGPLVLGAELIVKGDVRARASLWPQPLAKLRMQDPGLRIERDRDRLFLSAERPAKAVLLSSDTLIDFSDNLIDLVPGESHVISAPGLGTTALKVRSLFGGATCL